MLQVNQLIGFGAAPSDAGLAASISYTDSAVDLTSQTTYTFSSRALGTAATGRRIIVCAHSLVAGNVAVSSCTVAGNAATAVMATGSRDNGGGGTYVQSRMFIVQVDSGTTGDITVTWASGVDRCAISVHAAYDLLSDTPTDTDTVGITTGTANGTLDISAGGIAIGCTNTFANATHTWTELTETLDSIYLGSTAGQTSAANAYASAQTALAITCQPASTVASIMLLASFR